MKQLKNPDPEALPTAGFGFAPASGS